MQVRFRCSSFSAHLNCDTRFDKSAVAKTWPLFRCRIVVEQVVKLLPRLHFLDPIGLRAALFQIAQEPLTRFHRDAKRAHRINHHSITELSKFLKREQWAFAELGHVREQW